MKKNILILSIAVALVGTITFYFGINNLARKELPIYATLPEFRFKDQHGNPFLRHHLLGKITVAEFIFTRCPSACPVMSSKTSVLYHQFSKEQNVQFISMTVDPEYDTYEVLKKYGERYGAADQRWHFLRNEDIKEVIHLSEKGFLLSAENLPSGHSTKLILIDRNAQVRGYFDYDDEEVVSQISQCIRQLFEEYKVD